MKMKDYREKLERYRNLSMGDEERAEFEKELEQYAALFEYFLDEEMPDSESMEKIEPMTFDSAENRKVKKKVSRRMLKLVVVMIAAVTVIVGGGMYLIPKAIDSYYYNPMEGQSGTMSDFGEINHIPGNFELYQKVHNQVDMSSGRLLSMSTTHVGPAKYEILKSTINDFLGDISVFSITLDKGEVTSDLTNVASNSNIPLLTRGNYLEIPTYQSIQQDGQRGYDWLFQDVLDTFAKIPDSAWINVSLTFAEDKSLEELKNLVAENPQVKFLSTNIAAPYSLESRNPYSNWGFRLTDPYATMYPQSYDGAFRRKFEQKYPSILSANSISIESSEEKIREFLGSSLQYLVDHQEDNFDYIRLGGQDMEGVVPYFDKEQVEETISNLKDGELTFKAIDVALQKEHFEEFVTNEAFFYMSLKDISLIGLNLTTQYDED